MMTSRNHAERPRERGYSLAEVLVATAIFTIIFIAALMIYDRSNRVFKDTVEAGDLQQQVRVSFDNLIAEVRMAGFDFDRDGTPSGAQRYQQPDEQIEFASPSAITIRGNLDAELDAANDNGRETDYEPPAGQFPVVTTANEEIVTYALKSVSGPNADSIQFYADTRKPRRTYPGGSDEQLVTISGVDLCTGGCMNPPYTLYRIALKDGDLTNPSDPSNFVWTPIADNIRSVRFQYFQDHLATVAVVPNGGAGQYLVSSAMTPATLAARTVRENINAIRVEIVGMNAQPAMAYVSPIETALPADQQVAAAKSYRQYRLESLVVPRNIGLRGMQEFDTNPPGAPKVLDVSSVGCGVARVTWEAPASGIVDSYAVLYDTNPSGTFSSIPLDFGQALEGHVQGLNPAVPYYFVVVAQNSHGSMRSVNVSAGIQPRNPTKADMPVVTDASGDPDGSPKLEGAITVAFATPSTNKDPYDVSSTGADQIQIPQPVKGELTAWRIYRSEDPLVPAVAANQIWPAAGPSPLAAPTVDTGGNGTFVDNSPLVSCRPYYYRFIGEEAACASSDAFNLGPAPPTGTLKSIALSEPSEPSGPGMMYATANPEKAQQVTFTAGSSCAADPCTINLQWPQVLKDVNGKAMYAPEYSVRRITSSASGDVAGTEETIVAADTNLADGTVTAVVSPSQPAVGTFYRYSVAARHTGGADCATLLQGEFSDQRNFPCIQIAAISPPTFTIDGSGSLDDPWLVTDAGSVSIQTKPGAVVVKGQIQTLAGAKIADLAGIITGADTASLTGVATPADGEIYRLVITVSDSGGCSNTEYRYLRDSGNNCCLAPYKFAGGTVADPTILTAVGTSNEVYDVKLQNLCGDALTLKSVRITWPTTGNPSLLSVSFPPATGTTPIVKTVDSNVQPQVVTLPAGALTSIGANTPYVIRIVFSKSVAKENAAFTVAPIYDRAASSETNTSCRIVQTPF